jgi:exo-beta-1,3-glucanase (GH17 family)
MLGLSVHAEENHKEHPFFHKHSEETLKSNFLRNQELVQEIIDLANKYKDIVSAISIGNEIRSHWSNHMLPVNRMIEITNTIKDRTGIPVTYCEEYQLWLDELEVLAQHVDFISLHTYPAWQGFNIDEALAVATKNYLQVQNKYPNKYCIITETGWPTKSHGSRIKIEYANVTNQRKYITEITEWAKNNDTLVYLFEAFDEPWKGGSNPIEPEKNWGLYDVNRNLKSE